MNKIFYFIIILFSFQSINGQDKSIKGVIKSINNEEIALASVKLLNSNKEVLFSTLSKEDGTFSINVNQLGNFYLEISALGFDKFSTDFFEFNQTYISNSLIEIKLKLSTTLLSDVVVKSKVGFTEIEPGRVVYNVKDLPVTNGASAGDILKLMPSMAMGGPPGVSRDVRYRGLEKSYTLVLIDGKNTGVTGNNRETVVNQIPASSVDYIEIISNPGPEFDGDGVNGVVNIVLKKQKQNGTHGALSLMSDNRNGYNASGNLSFNKNKISAFLNFDRNEVKFQNDNVIKEEAEVVRFSNNQISGLTNSASLEDKLTPTQNLKFGLGYDITRNGNISLEYLQGSIFDNKNKVNDTYNYVANGSFKDRVLRTEEKSEDFRYKQIVLGYSQMLNNKLNLKFNTSYNYGDQPNYTLQSDQKLKLDGALVDNKPALQIRNQDNIDRNIFSQIDLSYLKSNKYNLKAGLKISSRVRDAVSQLSRFDYNIQNYSSTIQGADNFEYNEVIYAAYIDNKLVLNKLVLNAGLRVELTDINSSSAVNSNQGNDSYLIPLPSLSFNYNITDNQYFKGSFGRRIRRAGFRDLNPFIDDSDPLKVKSGNASLNPEISWSYELGYLKNFKRIYTGANVFYRDINDIIQKTLTTLPAGGIIEQPTNFSSAYLGGVEFLIGGSLAKWLNFNANYSQFVSEIKDNTFGGGDALADQFKWSSKLITDIILPKQFNVQLAYNIIGPKESSQKTEEILQFMDLGITKPIKGNGTIMFRISDVFNTNEKIRNEFTTTQTNFRVQTTPGKLVSLGFAYNF